jgi:subtilase family serine protease
MRKLLAAGSAVGLGVVGLMGVSAAPALAKTPRVARVAVARPLAHTIPVPFAQPPTTRQCQRSTGLACYSPGQIEAAYDMGPLYAKGLTGTGQTIVLVDSFGSPTITSDLATFDAAFNLPAPPSFQIIQPVGAVPPFDPSNASMVGWAEETSLDVEYSHAMAPGANILLVETPVAETEGAQGFPQIIAAENYVINHNLGSVISQSFAATEQTFHSAQTLLSLRSAYENAVQNDVTVLGSTGDTGSAGYSNKAGTLLYTSPVVSWPASDPLVTAIGGTQLHLDAKGQRTSPDNVWNDTNQLGSPAAGSGGTSVVFGRPTYQNSVKGVVGSQRGVPDVSMSAAVNGGVLVYLGFGGIPGPGFYIIGGTSEASPEFSGVVAVADQAAGHRLGFLNPTLYALAAAGAPGLSDITIGNNAVTFMQKGKTYTVPGYLAAPGYDLASGLGTVDGAKLVPELAAAS